MINIDSRGVSYIRKFLYAIFLFILSGCMSRYDPVQWIKPQDFKLNDVVVVWENNPNIQIDMQYQKSKFQPNASPSETQQESVRSRVRDIVQLLQTDAANSLSVALEKAGVNKGPKYRIVLRPHSVFQSDSGFIGTTVSIQISVFDQTGEKRWGSLIHFSDDGYTLGYGMSKPGSAFVSNFVAETMRAFRKAQLVNERA